VWGHRAFSVDRLALSVDPPQAVFSVFVAHGDIATVFEAVRDSARVFAILKPFGKGFRGSRDHLSECKDVRASEEFDRVGELGVLWGARGIYDLPKGISFRWGGFRVEGAEVD